MNRHLISYFQFFCTSILLTLFVANLYTVLGVLFYLFVIASFSRKQKTLKVDTPMHYVDLSSELQEDHLLEDQLQNLIFSRDLASLFRLK